MKLLLDQNVYGSTERLLQSLGHDAVRVSRIGYGRATDEELVALAEEQERIIVTRDRDFGNLIFLGGRRCGVIYLRVLPATQDAVHSELVRVLNSYDEARLATAFVVVEPGKHRIRHLPPQR